MTNVKFLINDAINSMNNFSKKIFTYSIIITVLSFLIACSLYVYSKINFEYYDYCVKASNNFLNICEYGIGGMLCSIISDIVHKCIKYDI